MWDNIYIRGGAYLGLDESRASPKCEEGDLCHGKVERAVASLLGEAGNLCFEGLRGGGHKEQRVKRGA